jgi:septum formation protein
MSPASAAIRKRMPKKHAIDSFSGFSLENDIGEKPAQPFAPLCLGTSSQNRIRIAKACGWEFEIRFPDIDEKAIRCDDPFELPLLIAKAKADQISLFKEAIREKPCDVDEARQFLRSYSNDTVTTVGAMVATHVPSGRQATAVDVCSVTFGEINDEVVERVVARGRIMQSAGGFAIEDEDLYPLIKDMDGTAASILGFSVESAVRIVQEVSE